MATKADEVKQKYNVNLTLVFSLSKMSRPRRDYNLYIIGYRFASIYRSLINLWGNNMNSPNQFAKIK